MTAADTLTFEFLDEQYLTIGKSIAAIAIESGFDKETISKYLKLHNIPIRIARGRPPKQMIGQTFGRLAVVEFSHSLDGRAWWKCRCRCGKELPVCGKELRRKGNKRTVSCGSCPVKLSPNGTIPQVFFTKVLHGAKARALDVTVTIDELEQIFLSQQGKCALSGLPIVMSHKSRLCTASLDRKDSSRGYETDNVQFVHRFVNLMKLDFKEEVFVKLCAAIAKHAGVIGEISVDELSSIRNRRKRIPRTTSLQGA